MSICSDVVHAGFTWFGPPCCTWRMCYFLEVYVWSYRTALLPAVLSANMVCPTSLLKDCCSSAKYGTFSVKVTFPTVVSCSKFDACTLSSSCLFFPYRLLFPPGLLFPAVWLFLPNLLFPVGLLFSPGSLFPADWLFLSSMLFPERLLIAAFLF